MSILKRDDVAGQVRNAVRVFTRIAENAGYDDKVNDFLWRIVVEFPPPLTSLFTDILVLEPNFPKGRRFEDVWSLPPWQIENMVDWGGLRDRGVRERFGLHARGVCNVTSALQKRQSGAWSEKEFDAWLEEFWVPVAKARVDNDKKGEARLRDYIEKKLTPGIKGTLEALRIKDQTQFGIVGMSVDTTKEATSWAYREKGENPKKSLQGIAGEAVLKFFPALLQYSERPTKHRKPVLNPAWERKRDSIRSAVNQKLPKRRRHGRSR
jgi:hypothetical protein